MTVPSRVVHSDPDILGGTPVFVGTLVPLHALLDHLACDGSIDDFLDDFPIVSREQAVAAAREFGKPWYKDGLHFTCTRCGHCCTGEPGYVWVSENDLAAIAHKRAETPELVEALYTRSTPRGRTLREKSNGDCVFYEREQGCTVYDVRPPQCRTWPFWESNVATPEAWQRTCEVCPGSGKGELISAEEITQRLKIIRL